MIGVFLTSIKYAGQGSARFQQRKQPARWMVYTLIFVVVLSYLVQLGMGFQNLACLNSGPPSERYAPILQLISSEYQDCDPIDEGGCLLPFPSSYFSEDGRLNIGQKTLPRTKCGGYVKPTTFNTFDGFSLAGPILFSLSDVPSEWATTYSIENSTNPEVTRTFLLNANTSALVPHYIQVLEGSDPTLYSLYPARPLEPSQRYVVAVWHPDAPRSAAMDELLRGQSADAPRQEHYTLDILPKLAPFDRNWSLVWDFSTTAETFVNGIVCRSLMPKVN